MQWYLEVLKKYAVFDGRAHRTEFWMFTLVSTIISIVLSILDAILGTNGSGIGVLGAVYSLAVLPPSLAVSVRRLHDIGRQGLWLLLVLVPIVGWIVLIVWYAKAGDPSPNAWGRNPWDAPQPV